MSMLVEVSQERYGTHWCRDVGTRHTLNGGVEVVECLALNDLRANFATNAKHGEATLDNDKTRKGA
jgi:hypothetical protein